MATIKLLLRRQKTNDHGTAPIYLRIIKDRKAQFISLNLRVEDKDWDDERQRVKKSHPNSTRLNAYLALKVAEAEKLAYEKLSEDKTVKTADIKEELIGITKKQTNLFPFAQRYYEKFAGKGKFGTYKHYKSVFSKFEKFMEGKKLYIEDFSITLIKDYENYLRSELKNTQMTITSNMKAIKRVIREAIDEEIIGYEKNPFLRYRSEEGKSDKTFLTDEEIQSLENLNLEGNSKLELHRDTFIFSTYAGGLRISDICLLRWENFHNGYVTVNTMKTGTTVTIKLPNKALTILEKYKTETVKPKQYIFSLIDQEADIRDGKTRLNCIQYADMAINKSLKTMTATCNIEKRVTFHTARHTFATRALRKGMRIEYVSKLMAHSDIKVTQVYAKIVNEDLDKAMEIFND